MKTGKDILKGKCPTCGSKVNTFPAKKKQVDEPKVQEKTDQPAPVETPAAAEPKPKRKYVRKPKPVPVAEAQRPNLLLSPNLKSSPSASLV